MTANDSLPTAEEKNSLPTVEEIKREMEALQKKYGDNIRVSVFSDADLDMGEDEVIEDKSSGPDLSFDYLPKDIKQFLDRYVIKQDEAKKALAIAICDHYNHVMAYAKNPQLRKEDYTKQNIILVGPTGVGKTYLVRTIARLIGVPFVKADATKFSETGYVGGNVEDLVRDLIAQADGDVELASNGIIYLDEVDKIASAAQHSGRDVSGRGVQMGLLKLMEETDIDTRSPFDIQGQLQALMDQRRSGGKARKTIINTRHILFVVSGAFNGLKDIIKKRLHQTSLGFDAPIRTRDEEQDYFQFVSSQDFIEFGFEPEFIGRLPVHVACQALDVDDLFHILKYSAGSIIRQYRRAFEAYGVDAYFSDEGLREIAAQAAAERTGARGLMTVCERILRDYKFELASSDVDAFVVTRDVVRDPKKELDALMADPSKQRELVELERLQLYGVEDFRELGVQLVFTPESAGRVRELASKKSMGVVELCRRLFSSYKHGLPLLRKSTGQTAFVIDMTAVEDPDGTLESWVRDSYAKKEKAARKVGEGRARPTRARRSRSETKTATARSRTSRFKKEAGAEKPEKPARNRKSAESAKADAGEVKAGAKRKREGSPRKRTRATNPSSSSSELGKRSKSTEEESSNTPS